MTHSLGFEGLIDSETVDDDYVPGEGASIPTAPEDETDWGAIGERLQSLAQTQSSASAKSRALSVSALLRLRHGQREEAIRSLEQAAEASPRHVLAVQVLHQLESDSAPHIERLLENAAQGARKRGTQRAIWASLRRRLQSEGRHGELARLLDRLVRAGIAPEAWVVERAVRRLAIRESLAGLELPAERAPQLKVIAELLRKQAPVAPVDDGPFLLELSCLNAAREIRKGNVASALPWLRRSFAHDAWLAAFESSCELLGLDSSVAAEEAAGPTSEAPRDRTAEANSSLSQRRRALRALDQSDQAEAQALLTESEPTGGELNLAERALLGAWVGRPLRLSHNQAIAASRDWPTLAITLHDALAPTLGTDSCSQTARWLELGARAARSPQLSVLFEDSSRSEEKEARPPDELQAARDFVRAARDAEPDQVLEATRTVRAVLKQAAPSPIEAFIATKSRNRPRFRELIDEVVALQPSLQLAALHRDAGDDEAPPPEGLRSDLLSFIVLAERSWTETAPAAFWRDWSLAALQGGKSGPTGWRVVQAWVWWATRLLEESESGNDLELSQLPAFLGQLVAGEHAVASLALGSPWRESVQIPSHVAWADAWIPSSPDWLTPEPTPLNEAHAALQWPQNVKTLLTVFAGRFDELPSRRNDQGLDRSSRRCLAEIDEWAASRKNEAARVRAEGYWNTLLSSTTSSEGGEERVEQPLELQALERLAELDELSRGPGSGILWRRTLAEAFPEHLPSLLRLEEILQNDDPAWPMVEQIAPHLPSSAREAAMLALGAHAFVAGDFRKTRRLLEPLLEGASCPLFVARALQCVARDKRDDLLLEKCLLALKAFAATDLDLAAIGGELALLRLRQGSAEAARHALREALDACPQAFPLVHLDCVAAPASNPVERAQQVQILATVAKAPSQALQLWQETAALWLSAGDEEKTAQAQQEVLRLSPDDEAAFEFLLGFHEQSRDWSALRSLLEARLTQSLDAPGQLLRLELQFADVLIELSSFEEAKHHLELALKLAPQDLRALKQHAQISERLGAHGSEERSLVVLRDRLDDREERLDVVRRLAKLYLEHLGQLEKAMDAFQEVLASAPHDRDTQTKLVEVYSQLRLTERATQLQTKLIQEAKTPEEKREGALELARIYEEIGKDPGRAAATLERTRKAWPLDAAVLEATIEFMDRHQSGAPRGLILERAGKDARRHLDGGHIDPALLDTLGRVARLSHSADEAAACFHARAAFLGEDAEALEAAGTDGLRSQIEDALSPRGLSAALRSVLRKTGAAMDSSISVDLGALGARPLLEGDTASRVAELATAMAWPSVELFVSNQVGARCLSVSSHPPRLVVGSEIEALPTLSREYLLLRAFKLQQMGAGAIARSKEEDRWPLLAALLHLFCPHWQPPLVDSRKVAKARALLEQGLARVGYDDDVPMLALEAIGALGGQVHGLGDAPRILANRASLVGVGSLAAVFDAMAAGEGKRIAPTGPSRFRWIESHPEARDLVLFMTGPAYTDARALLGLAQSRSKRPPENRPSLPSMSALPPTRSSGPPTPPLRSGRSRPPSPPTRPPANGDGASKDQDSEDDETE